MHLVTAQAGLELLGDEPRECVAFCVYGAPRKPVEAAQIEARPEFPKIDSIQHASAPERRLRNWSAVGLDRGDRGCPRRRRRWTALALRKSFALRPLDEISPPLRIARERIDELEPFERIARVKYSRLEEARTALQERDAPAKIPVDCGSADDHGKA